MSLKFGRVLICWLRWHVKVAQTHFKYMGSTRYGMFLAYKREDPFSLKVLDEE